MEELGKLEELAELAELVEKMLECMNDTISIEIWDKKGRIHMKEDVFKAVFKGQAVLKSNHLRNNTSSLTVKTGRCEMFCLIDNPKYEETTEVTI